SALALGHPHWDRLRVRAGLAAQPGGLARQRFVRFPFGRPLEDPGDLGEQVSPATRELAEPGHRGCLLTAAQLTHRHGAGPPPLAAAWRKAGRESRSNRLPEFVLGSPAQLASTTEKHVDGNPDERVLGDPLSLSPALTVESPADPRQLV